MVVKLFVRSVVQVQVNATHSGVGRSTVSLIRDPARTAEGRIQLPRKSMSASPRSAIEGSGLPITPSSSQPIGTSHVTVINTLREKPGVAAMFGRASGKPSKRGSVVYLDTPVSPSVPEMEGTSAGGWGWGRGEGILF